MSHLATPARPDTRRDPPAEVSGSAVVLTVLAVFAMVLVILAYAAIEGGHHDAEALAAEARLAAEQGKSIPAQVVRTQGAGAAVIQTNQSQERP